MFPRRMRTRRRFPPIETQGTYRLGLILPPPKKNMQSVACWHLSNGQNPSNWDDLATHHCSNKRVLWFNYIVAPRIGNASTVRGTESSPELDRCEFSKAYSASALQTGRHLGEDFGKTLWVLGGAIAGSPGMMYFPILIEELFRAPEFSKSQGSSFCGIRTISNHEQLGDKWYFPLFIPVFLVT